MVQAELGLHPGPPERIDRTENRLEVKTSVLCLEKDGTAVVQS